MGLEAANKPGEVITSGDKLAVGLADTFGRFMLERNGFVDHDAAQAEVLPNATMLEISRASRLDVATATRLMEGGVPLKDQNGRRWVATLGEPPKIEGLVYRARKAVVTGQAINTLQSQRTPVQLSPANRA